MLFRARGPTNVAAEFEQDLSRCFDADKTALNNGRNLL